jgi:transcriptional regulator with XRE-family HTH domain
MAKPTLSVNLETLDRLRDGQLWGSFAKQLGISEGTISRIRHGKSKPGAEFIAAVVTTFPVRMEDVVTVEDAA